MSPDLHAMRTFEDQVFVVDSAFENCQVFTTSGDPLMFFGGPGGARGACYLPAGAWVGTEGLELFRAELDADFEPNALIAVTNFYGGQRVSFYALGRSRRFWYGNWGGGLPLRGRGVRRGTWPRASSGAALVCRQSLQQVDELPNCLQVQSGRCLLQIETSPPSTERRITMKILVHWKGLNSSSAARQYLERRLSFALGRLEHRVRGVRALFSDTNGARGGEDLSCRLQVTSRSGLVQVEERHRDLYAAIDLAVERMHRTLARTLEREHFQNTGRWRAEGLERRRHAAFGRGALS
jgi:ribosomal subunit interface protein